MHQKLLFTIVIATTVWFVAIVARLGDLHTATPDHYIVQDFAYHSIVIDAFLDRRISDPWSIDSQLQAINHFFGYHYSRAMPIGISPVGIVLFGISTKLFGVATKAAFSSWIYLSLIIFLASIMKLFKTLDKKQSLANNTYFRILTVLGLCIFSSTSINAIALGQTTYLALGCLIFLFTSLQSKASSRAQSILEGLLLTALTLKPAYLLIGICLCLQFRRRNSLAAFLGIGASFFILFAMIFSTTSILSYFKALSLYSSQLPTTYSLGTTDKEISTLRGLLTPLDSNFALYFSTITYLCAAFFALFMSAAKTKSSSLTILLSLGASLLFSPYIGTYENLLLTLPLITLQIEQPKLSLSRFIASMVIYTLLLNLNFTAYDNTSAQFFTKIILIFVGIAISTKLTIKESAIEY